MNSGGGCASHTAYLISQQHYIHFHLGTKNVSTLPGYLSTFKNGIGALA